MVDALLKEDQDCDCSKIKTSRTEFLTTTTFCIWSQVLKGIYQDFIVKNHDSHVAFLNSQENRFFLDINEETWPLFQIPISTKLLSMSN